MNGTIRHGKLYFLAPEGWLVTTLICRTEPKNRNSSIVRKLKTKQEMHRRNGPVTKSWSQSWGRKILYGVKDCKKEVGFKPALKEWGTSGWWELWVDKWRRCRIVAKKVSQRQYEIRLTETSIDSWLTNKVRHIQRNNHELILNKVGSRARMTRDEEQMLQWVRTDMRLCRWDL